MADAAVALEAHGRHASSRPNRSPAQTSLPRGQSGAGLVLLLAVAAAELELVVGGGGVEEVVGVQPRTGR